MHDLVDSAIVESGIAETEQSVIMTMWLEDETLDEALWQFLYVVFPTADYEEDCRSDLVIVIANSQWEKRIGWRVSDLNGLNRNVVGEEEPDIEAAI